MITPLVDDGSLDVAGTEQLVEHILAGGVTGLFALGTTGEGPSLDLETKTLFVEKVCQFAKGRVPVFVGVTDASLSQALKLQDHASKCGAAAIVSAPPFYFSIEQEEVFDYLQNLANQSTIPLMIYNIPSCAKNTIEFETVRRCADVKNIIGIKDSSGDLEFVQKVADEFRGEQDFMLFNGPEELLGKAVGIGADGGVCGGANLFPELYVQLYAAAATGDNAKTLELSLAVDTVFEKIYRAENSSLKIVQGLKAALSSLHVCGNTTLPPLPLLNDRESRRIQESTMQLKEWLYGEVLPSTSTFTPRVHRTH